MAPFPPPRSARGRSISRRGTHGGKRVVFVTPSAKSAQEEAKKYSERGMRTEVKKEKDDTGTYVFTVFVFDMGF